MLQKETVNSIIKASVISNDLIRTWEGLFCEEAENYRVNQSGHHILDEDDDERQRLLRAQYLLNQLPHYFLMPTGVISSQWSCIIEYN
jgi:hypothetical protein